MGPVIRRVASSAMFITALVVVVAAQQPQPSLQTPRVTPANAMAPAASTAQANVDEKFELNITERRITEHDFFASTAIETGEASAPGLSLRVGVAVGASEIDVLLRNVRGSVRFRGSLDALQRILDARRPLSAPPTSVP